MFYYLQPLTIKTGLPQRPFVSVEVTSPFHLRGFVIVIPLTMDNLLPLLSHEHNFFPLRRRKKKTKGNRNKTRGGDLNLYLSPLQPRPLPSPPPFLQPRDAAQTRPLKTTYCPAGAGVAPWLSIKLWTRQSHFNSQSGSMPGVVELIPSP